MTPQEYRRKYMGPKTDYREYAFSWEHWPEFIAWMEKNKVSWQYRKPAPNAVFGDDLRHCNCLLMDNSNKVHFMKTDGWSSLEKLNAGMRWSGGSSDILLHPMILRPATTVKLKEMDF